MDVSKAYKILDIEVGSSIKDIRHAYYIKALKNHPDKHNGSKEAHERFIEITDAYNTIINSYENVSPNVEIKTKIAKDYSSILREFLIDKLGIDDAEKITSFFISKKENIVGLIINFISKHNLDPVIKFINDYNDILNIDQSIIELINKNISKKATKNQDEDVVILNPTNGQFLKYDAFNGVWTNQT